MKTAFEAQIEEEEKLNERILKNLKKMKLEETK